MKIEEMINNDMRKGVYFETEDNTLLERKRFQDFLYQNVKNNEHSNKMYPALNQPAQLYGTAKTHLHTVSKFQTYHSKNRNLHL